MRTRAIHRRSATVAILAAAAVLCVAGAPWPGPAGAGQAGPAEAAAAAAEQRVRDELRALERSLPRLRSDDIVTGVVRPDAPVVLGVRMVAGESGPTPVVRGRTDLPPGSRVHLQWGAAAGAGATDAVRVDPGGEFEARLPLAGPDAVLLRGPVRIAVEIEPLRRRGRPGGPDGTARADAPPAEPVSAVAWVRVGDPESARAQRELAVQALRDLTALEAAEGRGPANLRDLSRAARDGDLSPAAAVVEHARLRAADARAHADQGPAARRRAAAAWTAALDDLRADARVLPRAIRGLEDTLGPRPWPSTAGAAETLRRALDRWLLGLHRDVLAELGGDGRDFPIRAEHVLPDLHAERTTDALWRDVEQARAAVIEAAVAHADPAAGPLADAVAAAHGMRAAARDMHRLVESAGDPGFDREAWTRAAAAMEAAGDAADRHPGLLDAVAPAWPADGRMAALRRVLAAVPPYLEAAAAAVESPGDDDARAAYRRAAETLARDLDTVAPRD